MVTTKNVRSITTDRRKSVRVVMLQCAVLSVALCQSRPAGSQTTNWSPISVTHSFTDQTRRSLWTVDSTSAVRIGGGTDGPTAFLNVYGAAVLSGNRIAVADAGSYQIRLFAPNGAFIRSFGRKGQGPGEFNSLWSLQRSGDSLMGIDASGRAHVFAPDGSLLRSYSRPYLPNGRATVRAGVLDGSAIVYGVDRSPQAETPSAMLWWRVQRQAASDSSDMFRLPAYRAAEERHWSPFGVVVAAADRVCAGYPDEFDVTCFDSRGKPLFRIRRDVRRRAISDDEKQFLRNAHIAANVGPRTSRETLEKEAAVFLFAETVPAFGTLAIATNGELWISEFHRAMGRPGPGATIAPTSPVRWNVFSRNGDWVADVMLPARFVPYEMGSDYVVGVTFDRDDVEYVVLYRIRRWP
jgi:hypothetical protein